jgi:hypothetical protein
MASLPPPTAISEGPGPCELDLVDVVGEVAFAHALAIERQLHERSMAREGRELRDPIPRRHYARTLDVSGARYIGAAALRTTVARDRVETLRLERGRCVPAAWTQITSQL